MINNYYQKHKERLRKERLWVAVDRCRWWHSLV